MSIRRSCRNHLPSFMQAAQLLVFIFGLAFPSFAAPSHRKPLATTPPMGWNDWAHYQCRLTAKTVLDNAKTLVNSGLAAHGYNTVTIDDCWMKKDRDAHGSLQVDSQRFPQGMKPIAQAIHGMGLKFGIYEDAGYETCGGGAGSGVPNGGGKDHFLQDARLFASWGVDYLKLDGCNLYMRPGTSKDAAYRKAYAAQSAALKSVDRPIVFSESAPAYFQGTPNWYDVLSWVKGYGQLWREGSDIANFDPKKPGNPRFNSVLWNYSYNLLLGRFQKPGNWNDADFIIGGDSGMSLPETRSQLALWSMMSAPLILSSDLDKLNPQAAAILGNRAVLAVDQDTLGRMATLVRRNRNMDVLFKQLSGGDYAIAVLNHGTSPISVELHPADFGFTSNAKCLLDARNLWSGTYQSATSGLHAYIAADDTAIWRIHPGLSCGTATHTGAITMVVAGEHDEMQGYSRCFAALGRVEECTGEPAEAWTVQASGALESEGRCLGIAHGKPTMQPCAPGHAEHWKYTLLCNLVNASGKCLSTIGPDSSPQRLTMQACGHNQPNQVWSLPN
jgi:alpha-galactosidase